MFVDLVGSTALSERLDPEDLGTVLRRFKEASVAAVVQFDGHVASYLGDGILVYFGYPHAHEDDAERAIRAGLAIVEALPHIRTEERLHARIGIATGLVVVGDVRGDGVAEDGAALGETPNLAARLQAIAEPDTIVIAPATRRLAGNAFAYAERGTFSLKGFSEKVPTWQVIGTRDVESRFIAAHGVAPARMVGRHAELQHLQDRWSRARAGTGQVALVSGEAGIGKSSLIESLCRELGDQPRVRLRYQCSPYHTNSALYPIIRQIGHAAGIGTDESDAAKLDKIAAILVDPLRETIQLAADLLSVAYEDRLGPLEIDPRQRKERTLEMLIEQLFALAHRQAVLLVVEDAHWLDPTTRELLDRTVARLAEKRVMMIVTFRPDFEPGWAAGPHVTRLALNRLDDGQVSSMVEQITEGKPVPPEVHELILAKAAGVPLYVEEVTRHILESGMLQERGGRYGLAGPLQKLAVPSTLQDLLMARLDRLGSAKEVAQTAATMGRQFTFALLAAVLPFPEDELRTALERLTAAEIIAPTGDPAAEVYTYRHALIQDTAYDSLLRSKRQSLHARIAEALRRQAPQVVETEPELLAHHYTMAARTEEALPYWQLAGRRAIERSANVEAARHLANALELLDGLPRGEWRNRQEIDIQVLRAGVLRSTDGIAADATGQAYSRIVDLCDRTGETEPLFPALNGLYAYHLVRAEYNLARDVASQLLALAERSGETQHRMVGHRAMGAVLLHIGELAPARDHLQEALDLYDPARHASLAYVYGTDHAAITASFLGIACALLGRPDTALAIQTDALAHVERLEHAHSVAQVLTYLCMLRLLRREVAEVEETAERLSRLSARHAFPFMGITADFWRSWAAASRNPDRETIARMRQAADAWWSSGAGNYKPYFLTLIAEIMGRAGLGDDALALLRRAARHRDETNEGWAAAETLRVEGELRRADPVSAEDCFRRALGRARDDGAAMFELRAATSLARLWRDQGKGAAASQLLEPLLGRFDEGSGTPDLEAAGRLAESNT